MLLIDLGTFYELGFKSLLTHDHSFSSDSTEQKKKGFLKISTMVA